MTDFGGWEMPLQYPSGTISEHMACRTDCAVFDVSHLGSVLIRGEGAFEGIQRSFTNDLTKIGPGRAQYTHLLDEDGSVIDDVIVWWIDVEEFFVLPNASNTDRVRAAVGGVDVTTERALIAVQGPHTREHLHSCLGEEVWTPRFEVKTVSIDSVRCVVAGTGYTGESGVEIHVPADHAERVWNLLVEEGIAPAGLGARDTLRLEAALPLFGHELGPGITPLQADLNWVVAWDKPEFIGREALLVERRKGVDRKLFGLETQGRRPPRAGSEVFLGDHRIGVVTSGNFSPILGHGIALALLEPQLAVGEQVTIRVRDSELPGRIVERPFVVPSRTKK